MSFNGCEENGRKVSKVGGGGVHSVNMIEGGATSQISNQSAVFIDGLAFLFSNWCLGYQYSHWLSIFAIVNEKKFLNTERWLAYLWWRTRLLTNSLAASPLPPPRSASPPKQKHSREILPATQAILFFKLINWRSDYGLAPTQFSWHM